MKKKYLHIAIIIIGTLFLMLGAFHTNIWYDESYTVAMMNHSFYEIYKIGATDVHPVLYYFMLKFVNLIFGNNIIIYRLFSIVPMMILAILGFTHIRKDFGENTGIIFSFFSFIYARTNKIFIRNKNVLMGNAFYYNYRFVRI